MSNSPFDFFDNGVWGGDGLLCVAGYQCCIDCCIFKYIRWVWRLVFSGFRILPDLLIVNRWDICRTVDLTEVALYLYRMLIRSCCVCLSGIICYAWVMYPAPIYTFLVHTRPPFLPPPSPLPPYVGTSPHLPSPILDPNKPSRLPKRPCMPRPPTLKPPPNPPIPIHLLHLIQQPQNLPPLPRPQTAHNPIQHDHAWRHGHHIRPKQVHPVAPEIVPAHAPEQRAEQQDRE